MNQTDTIGQDIMDLLRQRDKVKNRCLVVVETYLEKRGNMVNDYNEMWAKGRAEVAASILHTLGERTKIDHLLSESGLIKTDQ